MTASPATLAQLRAQLNETVDHALARSRAGASEAEMDRLETKAIELKNQITAIADGDRNARIASIGRFNGSDGSDLAGALIEAGYDRRNHASVTVAIEHALGYEAAGSLDGGSDIEDAVPARFVSAPLGIDERYLYPRFALVNLPSDATGVQSYRQKSRTLADPAAMAKAIDSISAKEESDTVAEVVSEPLKMIANVTSDVPNILLESSLFSGWIRDDLTAAWRAAVDTHIVSQVSAATIGTGGGGQNVFEDVLYTSEVVAAAGYSPDLVVVSPADALAIQLLQLEDGDTYAFAQTPPRFVVTTAVGDGEGFVADSRALGVLHLGPFSLRSFEENAGTTNSSTVRAESSGLFVVQRADAAASLAAGS